MDCLDDDDVDAKIPNPSDGGRSDTFDRIFDSSMVTDVNWMELYWSEVTVFCFFLPVPYHD